MNSKSISESGTLSGAEGLTDRNNTKTLNNDLPKDSKIRVDTMNDINDFD